MDLQHPVAALEELATCCYGLAGVLRDVQSGAASLDSPDFQLAAAAFDRSAALAASIVLRWAQDAMQRMHAASGNARKN